MSSPHKILGKFKKKTQATRTVIHRKTQKVSTIRLFTNHNYFESICINRFLNIFF